MTTVEEYLSTSYRPDCDYIDGAVLERNLGEYDHSRLQMSLAAYLFERERRWGVRVLPEQRVQVAQTRFRIPDVCIITGAPEPITRTPPLVCIEILSKDDRMEAMQDRIDDYLSFGVRYVWVIHPRTRRAYVHTSAGMHEAKDGIPQTENPAIEIPLATIFERM
jgi:Uma2 family endonuclease